jgi:hypothetical protein
VPAASAPHVPDVVLAVACVLIGAFAGAVAVRSAWQRRNWLAWIVAAGAATFVAGVVGQRVFPSVEAVHRLGAAAARTSAPGPFDAGVSIPAVNLQITPVALAGILIAALGLSLVLVFESSAEPRPAGPPLRPLEDDDTV